MATIHSVPVNSQVASAPATSAQPVKVLIPFNASGFLYGMERAVIELFDSLRPRIHPHFLLSGIMVREKVPVFVEIQRRGLSYSFFSDTGPWPVPARTRSPRYAGALLLSLLRRNRDVLKQAVRCDAVYLPGTRYAYYAILACIYCRLTGKRVIYQFHNLVLQPSRALRLLRFVVRDFIHSTALGFRLVADRNPCLLRRNNHVIPLVVYLPDTSGSGDSVLPRGKRVILFVGQVALHKGIDFLLEAMACLADYPDIVLLIIGGCSPEFRPVFDGLLADQRIAGRTIYLGYRNDAFRLMDGAYVYVHPTPPSRCLESFGRSALEAMACGIPTICFRAGAIQDVVADHQTGLVCEREDAGCLAENLRRFLDDRQFRDRCGANAAERFQNVYSPRNVAAGWERMLAGQCSVG